MTRPRRDPIAVVATHGLNRRPTRADREPLDLEAIAAWTAKNRAATRAYQDKPNAVTRRIYKAGA